MLKSPCSLSNPRACCSLITSEYLPSQSLAAFGALPWPPGHYLHGPVITDIIPILEVYPDSLLFFLHPKYDGLFTGFHPPFADPRRKP